MNVVSCNPYDAHVTGRRLLRCGDGRSVFKVYFVSIVGRAEPWRYEWDQCELDPGAFADSLQQRGLEGVGFVTAFPHITKVFRYAPTAEILLHVSAFRSGDWRVLPLDREEGYAEFACLAEAMIAADEYDAWARAESVEQYLEQWSSWEQGAVTVPGKLRQYWQ